VSEVKTPALNLDLYRKIPLLNPPLFYFYFSALSSISVKLCLQFLFALLKFKQTLSGFSICHTKNQHLSHPYRLEITWNIRERYDIKHAIKIKGTKQAEFKKLPNLKYPSNYSIGKHIKKPEEKTPPAFDNQSYNES